MGSQLSYYPQRCQEHAPAQLTPSPLRSQLKRHLLREAILNRSMPCRPPYPVHLCNVTMPTSLAAMMESLLIQFICLGDCMISVSAQGCVLCEGHRLARNKCRGNAGMPRGPVPRLQSRCPVSGLRDTLCHATLQATSPAPVQGPRDLP